MLQNIHSWQSSLLQCNISGNNNNNNLQHALLLTRKRNVANHFMCV
uniref:Uncharacterized protein n=1 Tax=Rhizophora mucronata TaxID=61149 RepID=A0A2P2LZ34_RHIMU